MFSLPTTPVLRELRNRAWCGREVAEVAPRWGAGTGVVIVDPAGSATAPQPSECLLSHFL